MGDVDEKKSQRHSMKNSLFNWQGMRARDGIAIQKGEELAKGIEEGPVRKQADTFVGVDRAGARSGLVGDISWAVAGGAFGCVCVK